MSNTNRFTKDPQDKLDYGNHWVNWLGSGESIVTSTWTVPTGITKDTDSISGTDTIVWLSGGTLGDIYACVNHIITNNTPAREADQTIYIRMVAR